MAASEALRPHPSSFRDPSGFVFCQDGEVYRQVNLAYQRHYDRLVDGGLYGKLTGAGLLVPHAEVDLSFACGLGAYRVIKPEPIGFVSYPYEWCFGQLKEAALATLRIQKTALDFGMSLKDASAYNIQFHHGKLILIDTLSFEEYRPGAPWVAYRQFCQHFLAPLALMRHRDVRLSQLLRVFLDGLPLDLASTLLPWRGWLSPALLLHIHLHAKSQRHFAGKAVRRPSAPRGMGRRAMLGLVDSLESAVGNLHWRPRRTEWASYYEETNYTPEAMIHKQRLVAELLDKTQSKTVWDLGANTGVFSRIAAQQGRQAISFDTDAAAVEANYAQCVKDGETRILPLVADLTNPSPGIGWVNQERKTLAERGPADAALALALIHHLAIANNLPFGSIADGLSRICRSLIIEFVPKEDSQVQRLLASREDCFPDYTRPAFEAEFSRSFAIHESAEIPGTARRLYLMQRI